MIWHTFSKETREMLDKYRERRGIGEYAPNKKKTTLTWCGHCGKTIDITDSDVVISMDGWYHKTCLEGRWGQK